MWEAEESVLIVGSLHDTRQVGGSTTVYGLCASIGNSKRTCAWSVCTYMLYVCTMYDHKYSCDQR